MERRLIPNRRNDDAADELVTQLVNSGQFTVIERAQLDAVLAAETGNRNRKGAVSAIEARRKEIAG